MVCSSSPRRGAIPPSRFHRGRPPRPQRSAAPRASRALLVAVVGCGLLAGCHQPPASDAAASAPDAAIPASARPADAEAPAARAHPDPTRPLPTFTVKVTLSDAAALEFRRTGETVIVSASYAGTPKPGIDPHDIDEIGEVDLGQVQKELPGAGSASFNGSAVPKARLKLIRGAPQVNINVYSGRHTSGDNLLGCDMFQGSVAFAASRPIMLHCALLTEQYDTHAITEPAPASSR